MNTNYLKIAEFLFKIQTKSFNPFKLNFAVTYRCNFKCKTCNIWKIYYNQPELEKEELKLGEIETLFEKSNFLRWISFTGGEPFLRHDLFQILKSAYENCKNLTIVNIPTNGFYTKKIVKISKKFLNKTSLPLFLVAISCDGIEKIHNSIKNKNSWKRAIRTFKKLSKLQKFHSNFHVTLEYTLSKLNERFFPLDIQELGKVGIDINKVHINIFQNSKFFYHNAFTRLSVNSSSIDKINVFRKMRKGKDFLTIFTNYYLKILSKNLKNNNYPFKYCFAGKSSVFLDPYGNVYPCIIFNKKMGNVRNFDYDLSKILESKKAITIKKMIQNNKCPKCFTPCELYQSMLLNPFEMVKYIII